MDERRKPAVPFGPQRQPLAHFGPMGADRPGVPRHQRRVVRGSSWTVLSTRTHEAVNGEMRYLWRAVERTAGFVSQMRRGRCSTPPAGHAAATNDRCANAHFALNDALPAAAPSRWSGAVNLIPWVQLDVASVPGGGGELRLMQRGSEFSIFAGSIELMSSRLSGSEQALASMTCARMRERPGPHILVGGLGLGFTLRTVLEDLGPDATITVAELVPEVVAWARGPLAAIHGESLSDPRVTIFEGDVSDMIEGVGSRYDAILLDVDNGPAGLTRAANDDLYDAYGLHEAQEALLPGGILSVWSAGPDPAFARRLRAAGFGVEDHRVRANGRRTGPRHVIWLATKPA